MKNQKRSFQPTETSNIPEGHQLKPLQVSLDDCHGDFNKMVKRFIKKVRKEEVLKPYYKRIMYHQTKSQLRREKRLEAIHKNKKENE